MPSGHLARAVAPELPELVVEPAPAVGPERQVASEAAAGRIAAASELAGREPVASGVAFAAASAPGVASGEPAVRRVPGVAARVAARPVLAIAVPGVAAVAVPAVAVQIAGPVLRVRPVLAELHQRQGESVQRRGNQRKQRKPSGQLR